jgi:hypothetical protein
MNKANPSKLPAMWLTRTSTLFIILILFCRVDVLVSHSAGSFLWFALFIILILFCRVDVLVSHSAGSFLWFALFIRKLPALWLTRTPTLQNNTKIMNKANHRKLPALWLTRTPTLQNNTKIMNKANHRKLPALWLTRTPTPLLEVFYGLPCSLF